MRPPLIAIRPSSSTAPSPSRMPGRRKPRKVERRLGLAMKSSLLTLMMIALVTGCQSQQARIDAGARRPFAGTYYRGNGTGYNINFDLRPDGSYDAKWLGCGG